MKFVGKKLSQTQWFVVLYLAGFLTLTLIAWLLKQGMKFL
ncbi:DUF2474 domain-containing protein [Rheinheimera tangshanensis]|jgi:hypothetical protein|uniref:DUF2474 domain-containing protein n=1 Tax=Rheinheimera tangshanensis TaxID=400153 RepID=A0A5C8M5X1_9GAMM|nr:MULTISPECIES: DUF2474 domain-containing protein [Rheinheimera]TXK83339.1 DUF2474 domain-containing protein [Rheinheimera tangshanensis]GGM44401.1 hypothetical protein GCM10010920_00760 [Rheinheimera tangshanensis]